MFHNSVFISFAVEDAVSIFISYSDGMKIAQLVDSGVEVMMRITVGPRMEGLKRKKSRNLFVLIPSIMAATLLVIGLTLLASYLLWTRRFKQNHGEPRDNLIIAEIDV